MPWDPDHTPRQDHDTAFPDDPARADIKELQADSDAYAKVYEMMDPVGFEAAPSGALPFKGPGDSVEWTDPEIEGSPGPAGKSAYEVAVDNGFGGTEAEWLASLIGLVWRGDYSDATAYLADDAVYSPTYGSAYVALQNNTGSAPPAPDSAPSANWSLLARAGSQGLPGTPGTNGSNGLQGLTGDPGPSEERRLVIDSGGAAQTLDLADFSFFTITLDDDITIDLVDSLGREVSAATIRFIQGTGAPFTATWTDSVLWFTEDGLAPVLADTEGLQNIVSVWQEDGQWFGVAPGFHGEAPPETFPVLAPDILAQYADTANQTTNYVSGTSYQVGNKRVGHLFVTTTMDSADPPVPYIVSGSAGVTTWEQGDSVVFSPTGTSHRRLTHFVGRNEAAGASAPITIGQVGDVGSLLTGVDVILVRTTASPDTAVALAVSKDVTNNASSNAPNATLGAASDATNRGLYCLARNATSATYTPEGTWTELTGSPQDLSSPVVRMSVFWRSDAFDTSISGSLSASNTWGIVATEMQQGATS